MTRGIGELEFVAAVPDPIAAAFVLLTLLGDTLVVFVALSFLYWIAPWDRTATRSAAMATVALSVAALGVVLAIKVLVSAPRPPDVVAVSGGLPGPIEGIVRSELDASGYGFPSGHSIAATVLYGGLATFLSVGDRRRRLIAAAVLVGFVAVSRVMIGVHYLVDVIVGVLLGVGLLLVGRAIATAGRRSIDSPDGAPIRPDRLFAFAAVLAGIGLGVSIGLDAPREVGMTALAFGTAIGGGLVWHLFGARALTAPSMGPIASVGTLAVAGGLWFVGLGVSAPIVTASLGAIGVGVVIVAPLVVGSRPAGSIG